MTLWETCLLGAIQGLTEFLPVSSSGHLVLAQHILPTRSPHAVAVDVALHVGTLGAVVLYFARDLRGLMRGLFRPDLGPSYARRWVGLITLATVPGLITYVVAGGWIEGTFESPGVVGGNLLVTAAVLAAVANLAPGERTDGDMRVWDALIIGAVQGAALLPGISRSGVTIAAGLLVGLRADVAARFSFLMAIPAIVGAELVHLPYFLQIPPQDALAVLAGTVVAGVTGWVAIDVLLRLVRQRKLGYFAVYCAVAGTLAIVGVGLGGS